MHCSVKEEIKKWVDRNFVHVHLMTVVDLGSLNINGSVRDIIPWAYGIDLAPGPGVDLVITAGEIPDSVLGFFGAVVGTSSMQYSASLENYKKEVIDLLRPGGLVFLTVCSPECKVKHTTSSVTEDTHRLTSHEIQELFQPEIYLSYHSAGDGHDMIFEGHLD